MTFDIGGLTGPSANEARSIASRSAIADVQNAPDSGEIRYGMEENGNYIVRVFQEEKMIAKGFVPETFQLSIQSRYGQPFGQGIASQGALGNALKVVGHTTLTSQAMTMQVWEGSEPLELQFEFEFVAEKDAYKEVIEPVLKLLRLVMPSTSDTGGVLAPPGPQIQWLNAGKDVVGSITDGIAHMAGAGSLKQTAKDVDGALKTAISGAKGKIQITIGRFMTFDNVVIEAVNQTWHSMFDDEGRPLRATVAITFKTFMVPTVEDLEHIFNHAPKSSPSDDRSR